MRQKVCASSLFQSFIYEVRCNRYVGLYVNTHYFDGMSLIHSQAKDTQWTSLYTLVVADISLLCDLTTLPYWASLYLVTLSGLPLLIKNTKGSP